MFVIAFTVIEFEWCHYFIANDIFYYWITIIIYTLILISVFVTLFIIMTTVFQITLRPILILSKCISLINISYSMEPIGLIVRNMNSKLYSFLEIVRMFVLLTSTYLYWHQFNPVIHIIQIIDIRYIILDYYHHSQTINNMDNQESTYLL